MTTMRAITAEVAARHGLTVADLIGPSIQQPVAHARQEAFAAIRATERFSLLQIGRLFNRHHTTVLTGARAHANRQGSAQ